MGILKKGHELKVRLEVLPAHLMASFLTRVPLPPSLSLWFLSYKMELISYLLCYLIGLRKDSIGQRFSKCGSGPPEVPETFSGSTRFLLLQGQNLLIYLNQNNL